MSKLYKEKRVVVAKRKTSSSSTKVATGHNLSNSKVSLGVSLIRGPVSITKEMAEQIDKML